LGLPLLFSVKKTVTGKMEGIPKPSKFPTRTQRKYKTNCEIVTLQANHSLIIENQKGKTNDTSQLPVELGLANLHKSQQRNMSGTNQTSKRLPKRKSPPKQQRIIPTRTHADLQ
jgi:hypothetical protein